LRDTVRKHMIPIRPLKALLTAFKMDVTKNRYASFSEVRHYCVHSANPVGQLVRYIHGHHEPQLHNFADEICTGLQIANFLQDLSVDLPRGRRAGSMFRIMPFPRSGLTSGRMVARATELCVCCRTWNRCQGKWDMIGLISLSQDFVWRTAGSACARKPATTESWSCCPPGDECGEHRVAWFSKLRLANGRIAWRQPG